MLISDSNLHDLDLSDESDSRSEKSVASSGASQRRKGSVALVLPLSACLSVCLSVALLINSYSHLSFICFVLALLVGCRVLDSNCPYDFFLYTLFCQLFGFYFVVFVVRDRFVEKKKKKKASLGLNLVLL